MPKEDKKNSDRPPGASEEKKPGPKKIRFSRWFFLLFALAAIGTVMLAYKGRNNASPFGNRIFQALSIEDLPFLERRSFLFPPAADDTAAISAPEERQVIEEAGAMKDSKNKDWWLDSGGIMYVAAEEFSTNLGALPEDSAWRKLYAKTNSKDTDSGYFPQNIFRLVTRSQWKNFSQSFYFNITNINLSKSSNRNESNGVLLFNRYQDEKNLYYVGIRTDGDAVIKKKIEGKYYTLAEKNFFSNGQPYDKESNPNLIPLDEWIGIKSEVINIDGNAVSIKLYVDRGKNTGWQPVLEIKDSRDKFGAAPFLSKGYAGIRTDFMDVHFKNYDIQKI